MRMIGAGSASATNLALACRWAKCWRLEDVIVEAHQDAEVISGPRTLIRSAR
jgi:hypothetical protein